MFYLTRVLDDVMRKVGPTELLRGDIVFWYFRRDCMKSKFLEYFSLLTYFRYAEYLIGTNTRTFPETIPDIESLCVKVLNAFHERASNLAQKAK